MLYVIWLSIEHHLNLVTVVSDVPSADCAAMPLPIWCTLLADLDLNSESILTQMSQPNKILILEQKPHTVDVSVSLYQLTRTAGWLAQMVVTLMVTHNGLVADVHTTNLFPKSRPSTTLHLGPLFTPYRLWAGLPRLCACHWHLQLLLFFETNNYRWLITFLHSSWQQGTQARKQGITHTVLFVKGAKCDWHNPHCCVHVCQPYENYPMLK